jgi:hypothetical protein
MSSLQFIVNPKTNRVIHVGKQTWKKLTSEEKSVGEELYKQRQLKQSRPKQSRKVKVIPDEESIIHVFPLDNSPLDTPPQKQDTCSICTDEVPCLGNTTKCCDQTLCKKCYLSMRTNKCPYCRKNDPIELTLEETKEKETNMSRSRRRDIDARVMSDIEIAREFDQDFDQEYEYDPEFINQNINRDANIMRVEINEHDANMMRRYMERELEVIVNERTVMRRIFISQLARRYRINL